MSYMEDLDKLAKEIKINLSELETFDSSESLA